MRRTVNFKFLACMMGALALSVVGIHFLHGFQVKRNAGALLRQAERAEEQGELDKTIHYLARYLAFEPKDEALAKYGLALEKQCHKTKSGPELQKRLIHVFFVFEKVLRRAPERRDVRRRQVDVAIALGRFTTARDHLKSLLEEPASQDAALEELLGQCLERNKNKEEYRAAAKAYNRSIKHDPHRLEAYQRLAELYRERLKDVHQADKAMGKMVTVNGGQYKAWLARAVYRMKYAREDKAALAEAGKDVAQAQKLAGDESTVIVAAAELARKRSDRDEERRLLKRGLELYPKEAGMYLALVQLEANDNKPVAALAYVDKGLKALPQHAELRALKCDLLIQKGDIDQAGKELARLPEGYSPDVVSLLKASISIGKGERGEAARILDELRVKLPPDSPLALQVNLLLGECQESLGNPDEALLAYREAVKKDLTSVRARLGVGSALMTLGNYPEAVREYRQIVELKQNAVGARLILAQALIFANLNKPRKRRDWSEVKDELERAAKSVPDSVDVPIWQAEVLMQEDGTQPERARRLLERTRDRDRDRVEPWVALANLLGRQNKPAEALRILDEAAGRPKIAGHLDISVGRARHLAKLLPKAQALKGLAAVEKDLGKYSKQDRLRLAGALGNAYFNLGHAKEGEAVWARLAKEQPQNLGLRLILFDLALNTGDETKMNRLIEQVRAIEPKGKGIYWRYTEGALLIFQAGKKDVRAERRESLLEKARNHVPELTKGRPRWSRIPALEGLIDEMEKHPASAIGHYQHAMQLGEHRPAVVRQLVQLLFEARRFAEADRAVRVLIDNEQREGLVAAGLGKLATMTLLQSDRDQALAVALDTVKETSKDYRDHLWLGQVLWGLGQTERAKKALLRARDLAADKPETWVTYVSFLASSGQKKEAEDAIEQARQRLPKNAMQLALGHCYERTGNIDKAEKHFQAALVERPRALEVLQDVASFYLRIDPVKAERHLEAILALREKVKAEDLIGARRSLAVVLAGTPNEPRFRRALKLIEENIKAGTGTEKAKDRRVKALLLATRTKHRKKAIRLFEDYRREGPLSADEQFALARLYEADNKWLKAQVLMVGLLRSDEGKKPAYYAYYARRLLEHNQVADAESWVDKLEEKQPNALRTKEIKARVLRAQGKHDAAVALLKEYAQSKDAQLGVPAMLLDEFSQTGESRDLYRAQAEEMYLRYIQQDSQPGRVVAYASFLGRQQRTREALDRCEEALKKGSAETVLPIAVEILRGGKVDPDQQRRVESWLAKAVATAPQPISLQLVLGNLHDYRGHYREAIATYEQILRNNGESLLARNNLAWLLALHAGQGVEALEEIQKAIDLGGPLPELLDTRAVIYLALRRTDKAIEDLGSSLEQVSGASTSTANRKFHLARAHWSRNEKTEAKRAFAEAKSAGLQETGLHPLELPAFRRLVKEMN